MGRGPQSERMSAESHHSFPSACLAASHEGCGLISCSLWLFSVLPILSQPVPAGMRLGSEQKEPVLGSLRGSDGVCEMSEGRRRCRDPLERGRARLQSSADPAAGDQLRPPMVHPQTTSSARSTVSAFKNAQKTRSEFYAVEVKGELREFFPPGTHLGL